MEDTLSGIRKIGVAQLKRKGSFAIPGLSLLRVHDVKGRGACQTKLFGNWSTLKLGLHIKEAIAKCARCVVDSAVKEISK